MSSYKNGAVIKCGDKKTVALLASHIGLCYKLSRICDLVIVTGDDKAVFCHKLVLCSLSRTLLDICVEEDAGNETTCIYLPDFSFEAVKSLVDTIYDSIGKAFVEVARTELTSVLGIQDVPLASSFGADGVPEAYAVKIEDHDEVGQKNEKEEESSTKRRNVRRSKTSEIEEFLHDHEEKFTERRRGRRSTKRQSYKEICDDDELGGNMQDIFEAAKSEMSYADGEYDRNEEWQPEFADINEAEVFNSGDKEDEKKFKDGEESHGEESPKSTPPLNRKWQPKEYKYELYKIYGRIRQPGNTKRKRGTPRTTFPDVNKAKKPKPSKAKETNHLKNKIGEDSHDDGDYIPGVKQEPESSDEDDIDKQTTNDSTNYQKKDTKTSIRDIVSGCKPININVKSAGGDFHIIPAGYMKRLHGNGSKSNRSKIDFTYKQNMVKPSFAAIVGVRRASDSPDSEELLVGRPLAWSYPCDEEEMNSQYDAVTNAYQQVFGFSEEDVHCNKHFIIAHFGTYANVPHEYKDPKREIGIGLYQRYKKMDPAALHCELEQRKEEQPAHERKEKLPTLTLQGDRCQLQFDPTLDTTKFEGVMVIGWHINKIRPSESSFGKAIGKVFNFDSDVAHNKKHFNTMWEQPSKLTDLFMRVLRDVWMNGTTSLPLSEHMFSQFKTVFERACAPRLLSNIIVGNLPEHMCTQCGKTFTVMSGTEYSLYKQHMKRHAIEKSFHLDCGCANVKKIRSNKARDRHMKIHHSDGKFVKCPKCVEVIEKDKLKDHIAKNHVESERFCEVCAKCCPNR